jgi:membrane fusion protein (multidrug efflux system)
LPASFSRTTRSLASDTSRYAVVAWLIAGLILTGWLAWFFFAKITVYEISTKARLEVNQSAHPIASLVASKIISTSLSLGQEVQAGDVLVELDASSEKLRLYEEESRLQALPPQFASIQKQIVALEQAKSEDQQVSLAVTQSARSRHKEAVAAANYAKEHERRLTKMVDSGAIPLIEALRAKAELQKLSYARDALSMDIHRSELEAQTRIHQEQAEIENRKREAARLKGELGTTRMTIARIKQNIENHFILSSAAGQIGSVVPLQVGTYVAVGEKLGTVVPRNELRIVADFPPASVLGRIHPGQSGRMRLDGFPWAQFGTIPAKVSRVGSEIRDNQVRVEFTPEAAGKSLILIQHGLPSAIEVSIEQISPALMVLRASGQLFSNSKQLPQPASEFKPS